MKKCLFIALFTIILVVSNLATGGQFLGIKPVQASTQSGRNTYAYEYNGQIYETDEEVYHLDWGGISKQYFDPILYD